MKTFRRAFFVTLVWACGAEAQVVSNYDALVDQGKSQLQSGATDGALANANAAIKVEPERWQAYALAGGALMNMKRYEDAADALSNAISRAPDDKKVALRELRKQCLVAEAGVTPAPQQKLGSPPAVTQQEVVLWKSIENSASPEDFRSYLQQYPQGAYAALATKRLDRLKEDEFARQVLQAKDLHSVEEYLDKYPAGAHVAQVRAQFPKSLFAMMADEVSSNDPCKVTVRKLWQFDRYDGNNAKNILLSATIVGDVLLRAYYHATFDVGTVDFRALQPELIARKSIRFDQYPVVPKESDGYDPAKTFEGIEIRASVTRIEVEHKESAFRDPKEAKDFLSASPDDCTVSGLSAKCKVKPVDVLALPVTAERTPEVVEALGRLSTMCRGGERSALANADASSTTAN